MTNEKLQTPRFLTARRCATWASATAGSTSAIWCARGSFRGPFASARLAWCGSNVRSWSGCKSASTRATISRHQQQQQEIWGPTSARRHHDKSAAPVWGGAFVFSGWGGSPRSTTRASVAAEAAMGYTLAGPAKPF